MAHLRKRKNRRIIDYLVRFFVLKRENHMKYNYDGIFVALVFCIILVGSYLFSFNNHFWGHSVEGALYFLAAVVGAGLFWIGLNIRKK